MVGPVNGVSIQSSANSDRVAKALQKFGITNPGTISFFKDEVRDKRGSRTGDEAREFNLNILNKLNGLSPQDITGTQDEKAFEILDKLFPETNTPNVTPAIGPIRGAASNPAPKQITNVPEIKVDFSRGRDGKPIVPPVYRHARMGSMAIHDNNNTYIVNENMFNKAAAKHNIPVGLGYFSHTDNVRTFVRDHEGVFNELVQDAGRDIVVDKKAWSKIVIETKKIERGLQATLEQNKKLFEKLQNPERKDGGTVTNSPSIPDFEPLPPPTFGKPPTRPEPLYEA